jgi:glycosyltransferase involved in cell wall biosynthesis
MHKYTGHDDIRVLPNCIPGALLDMQAQRGHRQVVIGWSGGASHGEDIQIVAGPLRTVLDSNKHTRLHLIGTDYRKTIDRRAVFTKWIPSDATLRYYRQIDFDIALCPLTGNLFDQSKSHIKALEAMALGIPVIASDVEPYRGLVVNGVNGYLCRRKADWTKRLRELCSDDAAREEMGTRARESARAWTIEANWHRWAQVYSSLV